MEQPGAVHIRVFNGNIYVERAPDAWVRVGDAATYRTLSYHEQCFMIAKAMKHGPDTELPR